VEAKMVYMQYAITTAQYPLPTLLCWVTYVCG